MSSLPPYAIYGVAKPFRAMGPTRLLIWAPMLQAQQSVRRDFFGRSSQLGVQKHVVQQCRRQTVVKAEDKPVDAKIER